MQVTAEDQKLYAMILEAVRRVKAELNAPKYDKWVDGVEAMQMLRITSKTTLQKMRDEGKIRYSQPEKKIILYDTASILEYIEKHAKETF